MPQSSPSALPELGLFSADTADLKAVETFAPSRELKIKWSVQVDSLKSMLAEATESPIETRALSLIVPPQSALVLPKRPAFEPGVLFVAPRLILDEVTRYLSWEEMTYQQRIIEDAEAEILGKPGWIMGIDYGMGESTTAFTESIWSKLAGAMQLPPAYLGVGPNCIPKPLPMPGDKNGGGTPE